MAGQYARAVQLPPVARIIVESEQTDRALVAAQFGIAAAEEHAQRFILRIVGAGRVPYLLVRRVFDGVDLEHWFGNCETRAGIDRAAFGDCGE